MTSNQISYWQLKEQILADRNREAETSRANKAQEALKDYANKVTEMLGKGNLSLGFNQLGETRRHNLATEGLEHLKNLISQYQAETGRMNVGLGFANLGLGYSQLGETYRANMANEAIKREANTNTFLRDRESYDLSNRQLSETVQHNRNVEEETHRNNVTNQLLQAYSLMNDINLGTAKVGLTAMNQLMGRRGYSERMFR